MKHFPKLIFIIIFTLLIFLFYYLKLNKFFNYENVLEVKNFILNFSIFGPLVIFFLFSLFNILALPTFFFIFFSGYLYGLFYGFIIAWLGMIIGLITSFIGSRYLFKKDIINKFGNTSIFKNLDYYVKKFHGWAVLFFRIFFVFPYNFQNIAYGITNIKISHYIIGSSIGIIPTTILYVVLGDLLGKNKINLTNIKNILLYLLIFIIIFGTIFFSTIFIKKLILYKNK